MRNPPKPAYVVHAVRTPIGKYRGALAKTRPDDLAAQMAGFRDVRYRLFAGGIVALHTGVRE